MKLLTRIGGSIALLYLVSVMLAVAAFGVKPMSVVQSAHADSSGVSVAPQKAGDMKQQAVAEPAQQEQGAIEKVAGIIPDWAEIMGVLFVLAGAITAATPTPKDNAALIIIRKVFDILAFNYGGAKNAAAERGKNRFS